MDQPATSSEKVEKPDGPPDASPKNKCDDQQIEKCKNDDQLCKPLTGNCVVKNNRNRKEVEKQLAALDQIKNDDQPPPKPKELSDAAALMKTALTDKSSPAMNIAFDFLNSNDKLGGKAVADVSSEIMAVIGGDPEPVMDDNNRIVAYKYTTGSREFVVDDPASVKNTQISILRKARLEGSIVQEAEKEISRKQKQIDDDDAAAAFKRYKLEVDDLRARVRAGRVNAVTPGEANELTTDQLRALAEQRGLRIDEGSKCDPERIKKCEGDNKLCNPSTGKCFKKDSRNQRIVDKQQAEHESSTRQALIAQLTAPSSSMDDQTRLQDMTEYMLSVPFEYRVRHIERWAASANKIRKQLQKADAAGFKNCELAQETAVECCRALLSPAADDDTYLTDYNKAQELSAEFIERVLARDTRADTTLQKVKLRWSGQHVREEVLQDVAAFPEVIDEALKFLVGKTTATKTQAFFTKPDTVSETFVLSDDVMARLFPLFGVAVFLANGYEEAIPFVSENLQTARGEHFRSVRYKIERFDGPIFSTLKTYLTASSADASATTLGETVVAMRAAVAEAPEDERQKADAFVRSLEAFVHTNTPESFAQREESARKYAVALTGIEEQSKTAQEKTSTEKCNTKRVDECQSRDELCKPSTGNCIKDNANNQRLVEKQRVENEKTEAESLAKEKAAGLKQRLELSARLGDFGIFKDVQERVARLQRLDSEISMHRRQVKFYKARNFLRRLNTDTSMQVKDMLKTLDQQYTKGLLKELTGNGVGEDREKARLAIATHHNAVMKSTFQDSVAALADGKRAKLHANNVASVGSAGLELGKNVMQTIAGYVSPDLLLNGGMLARNTVTGVLSGATPSWGVAQSSASTVSVKTRMISRLFEEGNEDGVDEFRIFKDTHRDLSRCVHVSLEGSTHRAPNDDTDADADPFRTIAIPATSRNASDRHTASSFIDIINGQQDFSWTRYLEYVCTDCLALVCALMREAKPQGIYTGEVPAPDALTTAVIAAFNLSVQQSEERVTLDSPLHKGAMEQRVTSPQFFDQGDIAYICDWALAYLNMHRFMKQHNFTSADRHQLHQLGMRMGYKEDFSSSHRGLREKLAKAGSTLSIVTGLGLGIRAGAMSNDNASSTMALSGVMGAVVGYLLPKLWANPHYAIHAAAAAQVLEAYVCVQNVTAATTRLQNGVKPLAFMLTARQSQASALVGFGATVAGAIKELAASTFYETQDDDSFGATLGVVAAKEAATTAVDTVDGFTNLLMGSMKKITGYTMSEAGTASLNIVGNLGVLVAPGTMSFARASMHESVDAMVITLGAYVFGAATTAAATALCAPAIIPAFVSTVSNLSGQAYNMYRRARVWWYEEGIPMIGQVFGQPVVWGLQRLGLKEFLIGSAFVGVLGAEVWLQIVNFYTNPVDEGGDAKRQWDNTWFEAARSGGGGETQSKLFRVKHGGLGTIVGKQLNPLTLVSGGAHNLVSWIVDFLTNRSMYDLMVLYAARQALQVCKYIGTAGKRRACNDLMKFLETTRGIATVSFSMVGIASTITTKTLGVGEKFAEMYGACGFVGGERTVLSMFGVGGGNRNTIAESLSPRRNRDFLGSLASKVFRPEEESDIMADFQSGDLGGESFDLLSGYRAASQLKDLGKDNPWLYNKVFGGERDSNNFQLLLLGLNSQIRAGANLSVGAKFWKM